MRVFLSVLAGLVIGCGALASNAAASDTLLGSQTLSAGQVLMSADGHYQLAMQSDGNLVLYLINGTSGARPVWNSGTAGDIGDRAVLQSNGNLVLLDPGNQTLWSSNTSSAGCTNLVVQDDGNLVLYNGTKAVWSTHTLNTVLASKDWLTPGERIFSYDEQYELLMQTDGNLVLYGATGALWSSGTWGIPGNYSIMRRDGNLVVVSSAARDLWTSKTYGNKGAYAHLQDDGNLVVYGGGKALWSSGTSAKRVKATPRFARPAFQPCPAPAPPPPPPAAPAPAPVVLVPKKTTLPKLPRLRVKMSISWTWNRGVTRLHRMQISQVPRQATITVSCKGKGCSRRPNKADWRHLRGLVHRLDGRRYRAGNKIFIAISKRGYRTEHVQVQIRYAALPKVRLL